MNGFSASQSHNASGCASQFGTAVKEQQLGYYHHSAAASVASPGEFVCRIIALHR
jgi:hypothetical protein